MRHVMSDCPAKTDEPIEMLFSGQTRMVPRNHVLEQLHIGVTRRMLWMMFATSTTRDACAITIATC